MFCQSKKWQIETDSLEVKMSSTVGKKDAKCLTQLFQQRNLQFWHFLTIFVLIGIDVTGNTVWLVASLF